MDKMFARLTQPRNSYDPPFDLSDMGFFSNRCRDRLQYRSIRSRGTRAQRRLNVRSSSRVSSTVVRALYMKAQRIDISVVVFDIIYDAGGSEYDLELAMWDIFANTAAVKLKGDTKNKYQSGSYDERHPGIWTGRLQQLRESSQSNVVQHPEKGYQIIDDGPSVTTAELASFYAYNVNAGIIVYRERAWLPYTRLRTYVRRACEMSPQMYYVDLRPRRQERDISGWLAHFNRVTQITADYRHSQSPGREAVDMVFDKYRAGRIQQRITAKQGEELNKQALVDPDLPLGEVMEHVRMNRANGDFTIEGTVGKEQMKVNTDEEVERHRIETENHPDEIQRALEHAARLAARRVA